MQGVKFDSAKPATDQLEPAWLLAVARVLGYGASKYAPRNWKGLTTTRLYASVLRHLLAWRGGEDYDEESGESHLTHASAAVMMLWWLALRGNRDDRTEEDTFRSAGVAGDEAVPGGGQRAPAAAPADQGGAQAARTDSGGK